METVEYKGYTIEIIQDDNARNPREDFEKTCSKMICFHNDLGDEHSYTKKELITMIKSGKYIYSPLYLYDHSGITMDTTGFSCSFDSGQVGYFIAEKEALRKECNWKKLTTKRIEIIKTHLKNEVQTYDHYLQGSVYGYSIKDEGGEELDSSWGYYGDDHEESGLIDDARSYIRLFLDAEVKERQINEGVQTSPKAVCSRGPLRRDCFD